LCGIKRVIEDLMDLALPEVEEMNPAALRSLMGMHEFSSLAGTKEIENDDSPGKELAAALAKMAEEIAKDPAKASRRPVLESIDTLLTKAEKRLGQSTSERPGP
jgi:hypothetical protein